MGVTVSLPNTFSNGTTADAGQVDANFTSLVNGLAKAINGTDGDTATGSVNFTGGLKKDSNEVVESVSGGHKMQSGYITVNAASGPQTVTFATAFSASPVVVIVPVTGSPGYDTPGTVSTGSFTFTSSVNSSISHHWIAIGS